MIKATDLIKIFDLGKVQVHALKGITIDIKKKEFVAVMGPSGSGKSTLLHQLALLDTSTSGDIEIDGFNTKDLTEKEKTQFRLIKLGYVFQQYAILPELTALENVYLPALTKGTKNKDYVKRGKELLEIVGLGDRINHLPSEMSGGQQQRIAIARGIVNKPKILFADEPCANLDTESSKQILKLFRKLNKELGQTIVMVTHEEWHKKYANRIITMKDGLIESHGRNK